MEERLRETGLPLALRMEDREGDRATEGVHDLGEVPAKDGGEDLKRAEYIHATAHLLGFETAGEILREKRFIQRRRHTIVTEGLLEGAKDHLKFVEDQGRDK